MTHHFKVQVKSKSVPRSISFQIILTALRLGSCYPSLMTTALALSRVIIFFEVT